MIAPAHTPEIVRARWVRGATLTFRDASPADAGFILSLRTDALKGKHLSATSSDVLSQREWLVKYQAGQGQAYFIVNCDDAPIGTVRLYDAQGDSFCWGSWILKDGAPRTAALESALMVYAYAMDHLGFRASHFDVRRANERVWQFHERFGAQRTSETEQDIFYRIDAAAVTTSRERYARYLPEGVTVGTLADID